MLFASLSRTVPDSLNEMDHDLNNEGKTPTAIQFDNICRIASLCRRESEQTSH